MSPSTQSGSTQSGYLRQAVPGLTPGGNVSADLNALLGGIKDANTGSYYSTIKFAPGTVLAARYDFFGAGLTQPDPYPLPANTSTSPLSKVETNFVGNNAGSGLSAPFDEVVDSVAIYVHPMTIKADLDILTQYSYFEFSILQKVQWDGKIEAYPAGMGYSGFSTQTTESGWQLGTSDPNARKRFGHFGKYLAPQLMFGFTIFFPPTSGPLQGVPLVPGAPVLTKDTATPTAGVGTWIRAHMIGILGRPVS